MQFLDGADTFEELDANLAKEISKFLHVVIPNTGFYANII